MIKKKELDTTESVPTVTVTEPVIVTEPVKKWDARSFAPLLCCPPKYHAIYVQMSKLNKKELRQFRDELRNYTGMNRLHTVLETEFEKALLDETINTND
jgi:hypothetical protein